VGGSRKHFKVQNKVHGPFTLTNIHLEESFKDRSDLNI
jgi:hypothetical protein